MFLVGKSGSGALTISLGLCLRLMVSSNNTVILMLSINVLYIISLAGFMSVTVCMYVCVYI